MARGYPVDAKVTAEVERGEFLIEMSATFRAYVTPGRVSGPPEDCYPDDMTDPEIDGLVEVTTYDAEGNKSTGAVAYDALDKDLCEALDKELGRATFDTVEPDFPDYADRDD